MKYRFITAAAFGVLLQIGCSEQGPAMDTRSSRECGLCHQAPPEDIGHTIHVFGRNFGCPACHQGNSISPFFTNAENHHNGTVDVVFGAPFDGDGQGRYDPSLQECSNVYCHGAFNQGARDTLHFSGTDTIDGRCGYCHNIDLMYTGHNGHIQGLGDTLDINNCGQCHPGYNLIDSTVNTADHIDGVTKATGECHRCHDW